MTQPLTLFNSLTRQLEEFTPVNPGEARVYTCGPTVYNYPHIGNMRAYVFADVLGRVLSYKGYKLTHVINITDVGHLTDDADAGEDKLEKAAKANAQSIWDVAKHYTEAYWADIKALNIREPAQWTIATDYVPQMIEFAKGIADKHCYELDSGLYFDVTTVADYGKLARAVTEEGQSRIDPVAGKRNAMDFAIWRKTPPGETRQMEWDSPWGRGAPGWHLECSVMSGAVLGFPFDIHTGGIDHREIHHPCEIAQNQAHCGSDASGAKVWMHNNFLVERSGKMSKSAGEFLRLQLLIDKGYHPLAYRLMCLQAHYRSELEFSWEGLQAALVRLKRMVLGVEALKSRHAGLDPASSWTPDQVRGDGSGYGDGSGAGAGSGDGSGYGDGSGAGAGSGDGSGYGVYIPPHEQLANVFAASICDDLNMPMALTAVEGFLALKNINIEKKIEEMDAVLGLTLLTLTREDLRIRPKDAQITEPEIEATLAARKDARAAKDYARSDALRDELAAKGVEVMDGDPLGWDWKLG